MSHPTILALFYRLGSEVKIGSDVYFSHTHDTHDNVTHELSQKNITQLLSAMHTNNG